MFCQKCGTKLEEDAVFCTNCGQKVGDDVKVETAAEKEVVKEDNQVLLEVKPTFKFSYEVLPLMLIYLFLSALVGVMIMGLSVKYGIITFLGCFGLSLIMLIIQTIFTKKQYNYKDYDFYKTKIIYKDSFLNLSEKEVKYKYIREVTMSQSLYQRLFNLGNVVLYTNAETGMGNGICISNVENVHEVYKKVKEIIG